MRTRSAKKLAQRIDLHYFKHAGGLRRWRRLLSIAAPAAGFVWLGGMAAAGNRAPYSSGPVSAAHAFIELKCEVCHTPETPFRAHVSEASCMTCHEAPGHPPGNYARLNFSGASSPKNSAGHNFPACADCHREHQGRGQLALAPDTGCIACHAESKVMTVGRFPQDHPEFAMMRAGASDPGTLKFNHAAHVGRQLPGPNGAETLECASCHRPEIARASSRKRTATGLMASINYEQQCARCHTLFFDAGLDATVPHEQPAVVRAAVNRSLQEFIAANPRALSETPAQPRRLPLNFPPAADVPARTSEEWVARRAASAEKYLWTKGCADCHTMTAAGSPGGLPQVAPVKLTGRWMPKARFDHAPHLMVECASCHTGALTSRRTSDVLMPAVASCATCHTPAKGASSQCVECHDYHDWTTTGSVKPQFKLTDFQ